MIPKREMNDAREGGSWEINLQREGEILRKYGGTCACVMPCWAPVECH